MKENSKISNDNEIYLKIDFQIQKLFSKMTKVTNTTTLAQIEKNILSKFKIDTKIKEKISLLKLHGLDPKGEDRQKQIGNLYNPKITVILDQIINLMVEDDYTYSFVNKTKVEDNTHNIIEIPYSNIIFYEGNTEQISYCINKKCKYTDKLSVLKEPYEKNIHSKSCVLNEINILSQIRHPNIPKFIGKVYNPYTYNFGLLCRHISGMTLETLVLDSQLLKDEEKWLILLKIAEIIEYLHKLNICYNNLAPSSIIVKSKGKIYLTDFSLSSFFNLKNLNQHLPQNTNTSKNKAFTMYSAPESIYKTHNDPSFDIWSFGALAFFLFSYSHPWNNNHFEASEEIFQRKLFDLNKVNSLEARNLIIMCCNFDPSLRPNAEIIRMNLSFHVSNYWKSGILGNKYFNNSKQRNSIDNVFNLNQLYLNKENLFNYSSHLSNNEGVKFNHHHHDKSNVDNEETNQMEKQGETTQTTDKFDSLKKGKLEMNQEIKGISKEQNKSSSFIKLENSPNNRDHKSSNKKEELNQSKLFDARKINKSNPKFN